MSRKNRNTRRTHKTRTRRRPAKRGQPISTGYHVRVFVPKRRRMVWRTGQKREAIRWLRRTLRRAIVGSRGEVQTHEGQLLYQAHRNKAGHLIAEEL